MDFITQQKDNEFCPIGSITNDPYPNMHCECWWDGGVCCRCHAPAMTEEEKREAGME